MHDRAATPTGAVKSAVAVAIEMMILLNIDLRITRVRPHVEKSVQRFRALIRVPASAGDRIRLMMQIFSDPCLGEPEDGSTH